MSDLMEFKPWGKIARGDSPAVYTEKLDGTNGAVVIVPWPDIEAGHPNWKSFHLADGGGIPYLIAAQSRNRFITPDQDNHGFAAWVWDNAEALIETLGEGRHYGEWYGAGIQRGYGLQKGDKRFALFNTERWDKYRDALGSAVPGLEVVTVLYNGPHDSDMAYELCERIEDLGSAHVPGYDRPEGVVVFTKHDQNLKKYFTKFEKGNYDPR